MPPADRPRRAGALALLLCCLLAATAGPAAAFKAEDFKVQGGRHATRWSAGGVGRHGPGGSGARQHHSFFRAPPPRLQNLSSTSFPLSLQKCADAGFCAAKRGVPGPAYTLSNPTLTKNSFTATLTPSAPPPLGTTGELTLTLTPFAGAVRAHVTEAGKAAAALRYEVPGVLPPDLGTAWGGAWGPGSTAPKAAGAGGAGRAALALPASAGGGWVTVGYAPFSLALHLGAGPPPAPGAIPAMSFNGGGFLDVQPLRLGGPGGNETWVETWKGHADARPRGPQAVAFDLAFPGGATLYGLPERAAPAALRPTAGPDPAFGTGGGAGNSNASETEIKAEPYRLYNLDVFEYEADSNFGLYGSIPAIIAHSPDGGSAAASSAGDKKGKGKEKAGGGAPASPTTVGALWLNAAEMWVDLLRPAGPAGPAETRWIAEAGVLDLWLFPGPTPADVARQLARVTGPTALPQLFSLGYHQCRWNYKDEADVKAVDAGFDAHDMPYDVIWLDIEHTDGEKRRGEEREGGRSSRAEERERKRGARASLQPRASLPIFLSHASPSLPLSLSLSLSLSRQALLHLGQDLLPQPQSPV